MSGLPASFADNGLPAQPITLFLCGDVMTGRGIDQVLPHPSTPVLYEPAVTDARTYVLLAEEAHGPLPRPVELSYIWGEALQELERVDPDVRIANLETAVTKSQDFWPGKGINYRMHPANIGCLQAAGIDACALANNHVLDWGYSGLAETLTSLRAAGIRSAGAGANRSEVRQPAVVETAGGGRVLVFSFGTSSSGIPAGWSAGEHRPGVWLLQDLSERTLRDIARNVRAFRGKGDVVVASIHWGGNWGYGIDRRQREFAHGLIDEAGIDVVHGHSSHHPRPIEVYRKKLILYGCGDFINDYEGIAGYERFRGDLVLMYFLRVEPSRGELLELTLRPLQIRRFRLKRACAADGRWLCDILNECSRPFGTRLEAQGDGSLRLRWNHRGG